VDARQVIHKWLNPALHGFNPFLVTDCRTRLNILSHFATLTL